MSTAFSAQDALVATMILTAAADAKLPPSETETVGSLIRRLPVFEGFGEGRFAEINALVAAALAEEGGLDAVLARIGEALPARLGETAYALACDVAVRGALEEVRLLEMLRDRLDVERLAAAAIERGARARYARP